MPKSKHKRKNNNEKVSNRRRLSRTLEAHYNGYRLKNGINNGSMAQIFNRELRKYLEECHDKRFDPSKEFMENKIREITKKAKMILNYGTEKIEGDELSLDRIDRSISESMISPFNFSKINKGEEKDVPETKAVVYLILSTNGLSDSDIQFILSCFSDEVAVHDPDQNSIRITAIDIVVITMMTHDSERFLHELSLRLVKDSMNSRCLEIGRDKYFDKYTRLQKFKDRARLMML